MKYSIIFSALSLFSLQQSANALPSKRDSVPDPDILNFALTLEHLENAFYTQSLAKYSKKDFAAAGYPDWVRNRFEEIAAHEETHVAFLETALTVAGATAVKPCIYKFPVTDPKSFVDLSMTLEGVGSSAYNGAASFIANKDYLTAAASILAVEARHSAWIDSAAENFNAWSTAFEIPLSLNQAFTLASGFITSCPSSNPALPVKAFPQLALSGTGRPGGMVTLEFVAPADNKPLYAAFMTGTGTKFVPVNSDKKVKIPQDLKGRVYVMITDDGATSSDETTVAGPTTIMFHFDSNGKVV